MHLTTALCCLALVIYGGAASALRPRRAVGWWTIAVALLWIPLNNKVLEGPVLLSVTSRHGFTLADLAGLAAFGAGALAVWPRATWHRDHTAAIRMLTLAALLALAFASAAAQTDSA